MGSKIAMYVCTVGLDHVPTYLQTSLTEREGENEKLVGKLKDLVGKFRELQTRAKAIQVYM